MTEKSATTATSGFPIASILTIIFVLAKIFGKISWSWWWVFSPLWISAGIVILIVLFLVFLAMLSAALE